MSDAVLCKWARVPLLALRFNVDTGRGRVLQP